MKESSATIVIDGVGRFQADRRDPYLYWLVPAKYLVRHAQGPDFEKADANNLLPLPDSRPADEKREDKQ